MNLKQILLASTLTILPILTTAQNYSLKNGIPTTEGIEKYVLENPWPVQKEVQKVVNDTIYWVDFSTKRFDEGDEKLGDYNSKTKMAIINNQGKFQAYELNKLSFEERKNIISANNFVRATMVHELIHEYRDQVVRELEIMGEDVDRDYKIKYELRGEAPFGVMFIDEGIAEYLSEKMDEIILPWRPFIPKNESQLLDKKNLHEVKYQYAPYFLKKFFKEIGIKKGIQTLVTNAPPTNKEILNPELFFQRLKLYDGPEFNPEDAR